MSFGLNLIERETPLKAWMSEYEFILVQSIDQLSHIIDKAIASPYVAFDLESTGLDTRVFDTGPMNRVVGYSLAFESKICYYIPIRHKVETPRGKNLPLAETNALIQKLLLSAVIVGHNWLKFDAEMMLASDGIKIKTFKSGEEITYHDSYVLARLAGYKPAGLKDLSKNLINKEMIGIKEVVTDIDDIDFGSVSPYEGLVYAASDAICTKEIFEHPTIQAPITEQKFIYNLERKTIYAVRKLERNKIKLDVDFCKQLDAELISKIETAVKTAHKILEDKTNGKLTSFKLDSPVEVSDVLFNIFDMNPKPEKGKNGSYTTDDEALEKLAKNYELAKVLQEYRMLTKFHRTYIKNMVNNVDKNGYLKFQFSSLQTDTGRFASPGGGKKGDGCSGVNIQAIPARYDKTKPNIRKCLKGDEDEVIVAMDWAGVELRVAANMSLEPIWLDRFLKGDGDLHTSTASIIYDKPESDVDKQERQTGKCVDPHSLLYVNGAYKRIGSLHSGRDVDTFYDVSDKNYKIKIDKNLDSKIKNFYSNGSDKKYLVATRRGITVCSARHRFELEDKTLVKSVDLQKGDILDELPYGLRATDPVEEINFNPFLKSQTRNDTFFIKVNQDLAYVLGLFTGDGGSSANACSIHTGGHVKYLEWANTVKEILEKLGLDTRLNKVQTTKLGHSNRKIYFGSRHTISIFQQLEVIGEDFKKSLTIPDFILNAKDEVKLSFLGGLIDTDGSVGKKGNIDLTTKSWKLAQDVCVLLASLDFHYSLEVTHNKTYGRNYFRIRIAKLNNLTLKPYLKCPWKIERVSEPVFKYNKFPKNHVLQVIPLEEGELVDIEVEHDSHMYLVNNMRTHNTFNFQSVYGGGPGALASTIGISIEDAKEKQQRFFGRLQTLRNFIKNLQKSAQKNHFCMTKFGRRRSLAGLYKSEFPKDRASADRQAVNAPIQGTAADLMKLAMIKIDEYIEEHNLDDHIKMVITMHDEICFRFKKTHINRIPDIENVMKLESVLQKIGWKVPLAVDVEVGATWDINYQYWDMKEYLEETYGVSEVNYIYSDDQNPEAHVEALDKWVKDKKDAKKIKEAGPKKESTSNEKSRDDFKKTGDSVAIKNFEPKSEMEDLILKPIEPVNVKETFKEEAMVKEDLFLSVSLTEPVKSDGVVPASANDLDKAFAVLKNAQLSDLPMDAHLKLKKAFYEQEIERILSGIPSIDDDGIEMAVVVHSPIDEMKKIYMGVILDTCKGRGKIKFVSSDKQELHQGWFEVDVLKASIMAKIFNL